MSIGATSAFMALILGAAGTTPVKSGERRALDSQAKEPNRPYIRVSFVRLDQNTNVPGRKRGLGLVEFFGVSGVDAWALGSETLAALGLAGAVVSPARPNLIETYKLSGSLEKGDDPGNGAVTYATIAFHYY